jgi:hypothetical protein
MVVHAPGDTDVVQFLNEVFFMRDFLIPLVLIVVVIAGIWIYLLASSTHAGPVAATTAAPTEAPTLPVAKKAAPHPKLDVARNSATLATASEPAVPPQRIEDKPAVRPRAPRPVPTGTPEQVNLGMDVTRVVELLGEPDLTALSIRRGSLSETYIYKKRPGQNLAFIRLEGGRVVTPQ